MRILEAAANTPDGVGSFGTILRMLTSLLATIPAPPFQNLEVGPLTLHGYGLTMGVAIVASLMLCEWGLKRQHVDTTRFMTAGFIAIAFGFLGARLYHVASEPSRFAENPEDILAIWQGGLGIYGAVLGGAFGALFFGPRFGIPRRAWADIAAPGLLLAQAIGRIGNYLNQELFGKPLDAWWALEVDLEHRPLAVAQEATFHPTFLYESLLNLGLFFVFLALCKRWTSRAPGVLLPLYVAAYSTVRIIVEPLRIDAAHEWFGVRQNVWVAGTLIVAGLVVAIIMQRRYARTGSSVAASSTAATPPAS
ncbi:MAG: lgt [Thermoleophilia bacterium]|nr:lgt [Thermoleophilia bacterium]